MSLSDMLGRTLRTGAASLIAFAPFAQAQSLHLPSQWSMVRTWSQDDLSRLAEEMRSRLEQQNGVYEYSTPLRGPIPGYGFPDATWNPDTRIALRLAEDQMGHWFIECSIGTEESGIRYRYPLGDTSGTPLEPTVRFTLHEDPFGGGRYRASVPLSDAFAQEATLCFDEATRALLVERRAQR
ncbi:MAG: hypothetical protein ACMXYM_02375 [Candidatus Woesearchaeota archaeon]